MIEFGDLLRRHGIPMAPLAAQAEVHPTILREAASGNRLLGPAAVEALQHAIEAKYPRALPDFHRWLGLPGAMLVSNPADTGDPETPLDDLAALADLSATIAAACADGMITNAELQSIEEHENRAFSLCHGQSAAWRERMGRKESLAV